MVTPPLLESKRGYRECTAVEITGVVCKPPLALRICFMHVCQLGIFGPKAFSLKAK